MRKRHATTDAENNESSFFMKITWRSYLLPALIGAILFEIINYALDPSNYFKTPSKVIFSFIIGAALGWMYEVIRQQSELVSVSMNQFDTLSKALEYQQVALTMLLKDRRHGEALTALLSASIQGHHIAFVNENEYLSFLIKAVEHSAKYQGVQRSPVRWFKDHANYLNVLRDQSMKSKTRIFIIDDTLEDQMNQDLNDSELMNDYWSNTGKDVKTFWVQSSVFKQNMHQIDIPEDFALYDEQLLIKYDVQHQTVTFDVLESIDDELEIFKQLQYQIDLKVPTPFIEIKP
jgi:hypothetical protein